LYAAPDAIADDTGSREWRSSDIAFIRTLIERIVASSHSHGKRIYLVGFSLGGFLALEFACTRPNAIAAAVSVSGTRFAPLANA
jgi:poly(3-hydroxybutyrate) depolymerase